MGAGADVDWLPLTGEVLPDWDDDWALVEREHFRNLSLQALESLCEHLTAQGRLRQALEVGLAVFAREPLRESAHRLLVRIYLADGNPFDAIRQFRLYRELALEPARDRALAADARAHARTAPRRARRQPPTRSPPPDRGRSRNGDAR